MMMRVNALARVLRDRPAKTTDSDGAPGRRVGRTTSPDMSVAARRRGLTRSSVYLALAESTG
jgi:hypothetical protein